MPLTVGFVGLGAMGYPMARSLQRRADAGGGGGGPRIGRVLVYNRTAAVAAAHAADCGTVAVPRLADLAPCDVVCLCVPTTAVSRALCRALGPHLRRGTLVVDHTSGVPRETRDLHDELDREYGLVYLDAPVSGGPRGAAAATLTCMVGSRGVPDAPDVDAPTVSPPPPPPPPPSSLRARRLHRVLDAVAGNIVYLGAVGAGNAVKTCNNFLNASHLALASECFYSLGVYGVDVPAAVRAINGSSGRSLQTEVRIPAECLSGRYGYGFELQLMLKDVRQARAFLAHCCRDRQAAPRIAERELLLPGWGRGLERLLREALARDGDGGARPPDYTRCVARYYDAAARERGRRTGEEKVHADDEVAAVAVDLDASLRRHGWWWWWASSPSATVGLVAGLGLVLGYAAGLRARDRSGGAPT